MLRSEEMLKVYLLLKYEIALFGTRMTFDYLEKQNIRVLSQLDEKSCADWERKCIIHVISSYEVKRVQCFVSLFPTIYTTEKLS